MRKRETKPLSVYLAEIHRTPLLKRAEEIALAKKIERGKKAKERLIKEREAAVAKKLAKGKLTREEKADFREKIRQLRKTIKQGEEAFKKFVEANLRLAFSIAKKYASMKKGVALLDLIPDANYGLVKAVEDFDWRLGNKFSTYATWWIKNYVFRRFSKRKKIDSPFSIDVPNRDDEEERPLRFSLEDKKTPSPETRANEEFIKETVKKALAELPGRERTILSWKFGLEDGICRTLKEVGVIMQLSKERVRQIIARIIRKLEKHGELRKLL